MKTVRILCLALCICGTMAGTLLGQLRSGHNTIRGIVTDANSGSVLPSVNVFLRGTTIGTTTQANGQYSVTELPGGEFDVVFSLVGYIREVRHVSLKDTALMEINAQLKPKDISLSQVEVTASAEEWNRLLPFFSRELLGTTENAKECTILNPEVISLSIGVTGDSLKALSDSTLIIDNNALGYRIFVQIDSFLLVSNTSWFILRCYPRYSEMRPHDEKQLRQWKEARAICHEHSFSHFLESAIHHTLRNAQFLVTVGDLRELHRGKGEELEEKNLRILPLHDSSTFSIDFSSDQVRVDRLDRYGSWKTPLKVFTILHDPGKPDFRDYVPQRQLVQATKEWKDQFNNEADAERQEEPSSSIVSIRQKSIVVDKFGNLVKPYSVAFRGFWATRRLADTLPFDYQPE